MNGELVLVEDSIFVMGIPVICELSFGAPLTLRTMIAMKKSIPHIIPGERWMRLLKHLNISIITASWLLPRVSTFFFGEEFLLSSSKTFSAFLSASVTKVRFSFSSSVTSFTFLSDLVAEGRFFPFSVAFFSFLSVLVVEGRIFSS